MKKNKIFHNITASAILLLAFLFPVSHAQLVDRNPEELQKIGVDVHLGDRLPLDLRFVDSSGDTVVLGSYFHRGKPVLLVLHYSDCPMLCSLVLDGIIQGTNQLSLVAGPDYDMLAVSIDPAETAQRTALFEERYRQMMKPGSVETAWSFLVGEESQSAALAEALGFRYYWVENRKEFAHPAVIFLLTEDGTISRYLYGTQFKELDLRLGLLEAAEGKIGTTVDQLILYCFHYDPDAGSYTLFAKNVMMLGGAVTLVVLGAFLVLMILWERRHRRTAVNAA